MPATPNDQNPFVEGDLNQELIDQMLNGGTVEQDPWSDETLQAEQWPGVDVHGAARRRDDRGDGC